MQPRHLAPFVGSYATAAHQPLFCEPALALQARLWQDQTMTYGTLIPDNTISMLLGLVSFDVHPSRTRHSLASTCQLGLLFQSSSAWQCSASPPQRCHQCRRHSSYTHWYRCSASSAPSSPPWPASIMRCSIWCGALDSLHAWLCHCSESGRTHAGRALSGVLPAAAPDTHPLQEVSADLHLRKRVSDRRTGEHAHAHTPGCISWAHLAPGS